MKKNNTQQAIAIKNLTKTYASGTEALRGVSFSIEKWDFFALLWPNGAGKSTTIGIISWLVNKTGGEVTIDGKSLDELGANARMGVGVVPQEFNFGIFEKVYEIVISQAGYYGISRRLAEANAEKYLKALGLWEKRDAQSRALSGGMKRRLMIARALVHNPSVLILDEPTAGVDLELRLGMYDFLRELNKEGTTIILTTHYLEEAETLCRNVAIIDRGTIVASGSIKELLASMEDESLVIELDREYSEKTLEIYHPIAHDTALDITVSSTHTLDDAIGILQKDGYKIKNIKPKTGRLEEFFLKSTKK
jgi:ABC-2 type transport system ATP-binding protein